MGAQEENGGEEGLLPGVLSAGGTAAGGRAGRGDGGRGALSLKGAIWTLLLTCCNALDQYPVVNLLIMIITICTVYTFLIESCPVVI